MNVMVCWRKNSCKPVDDLAKACRRLNLDFAHFRGVIFGNTFIGWAHARPASESEQAEAVMTSFDDPMVRVGDTIHAIPPQNMKVRR